MKRTAAHSRTRMLIALVLTAIALMALIGCGAQTQTSDSRQGFSASSLDDVAPEQAQAPASTAAPSQEPATVAAGLPAQANGSPTVCIDAGHQAEADLSADPIGPGSSTTKYATAGGATSVYDGTPEYQINLEVELKLQQALEERGVTVVMTRTANDITIPNSRRAQIANEAGAALAIHLHCDGVDDSTSTGFSTLVPGQNQWTEPICEESLRAGRAIQDAVCAQVGCADRGLVERTDLTGLNWSTVPALYVEMGFLSTPSEAQLLGTDEYQWQLAEAMADGIVIYINS